MAATGKALWTIALVALFAQGVPAATAIAVIHQDSALRTPPGLVAVGAGTCVDDSNDYASYYANVNLGEGVTTNYLASNGGHSWPNGTTIVPTLEDCGNWCRKDDNQCEFYWYNPGSAQDADGRPTAGSWGCEFFKTGITKGDGFGGRTCYGVVPIPPPTAAPTAYPTAAPTAVSTASSSSPSASAKGDPHLQNINGQRFDLMRPGWHVLLHIPKGVDAQHALLRVDAEVQRLGPQCGDMYFEHMNITGTWVGAQHHGILHFHAGEVGGEEEPTWMAFGAVQLKVVHVHWQGIHYLNLMAKHLGRTGFMVGGLLGEDDHTYEATPDHDCVPTLNLHGTTMGIDSAPQSAPPASSAEATLA
jgi:hypothetical protein